MTSTQQVPILPLKLSPVSDNALIGLTSIRSSNMSYCCGKSKYKNAPQVRTKRDLTLKKNSKLQYTDKQKDVLLF